MRNTNWRRTVACGVALSLTACESPTRPLEYKISGRVEDGIANGIQGVVMSFGDGEIPAITAADGTWSKVGLTGSVTVTPVHAGYRFVPESRTVTAATSTLRFTGGYEISGTVEDSTGAGVSDVVVSFGAGLGAVTTGSDGKWSRLALTGSVKVTPDRVLYKFVPANRTLTAAATGLTFTGTYSIFGVVVDSANHNLSGVTISFNGGYGSLITGGSWSKAGLSGSVTVTPSRNSYTFTPASRTVTAPVSNMEFRGDRLRLAIVVQPPNSIASGAVMSPAVQVAVQNADGTTATAASPAITVALTGADAAPGGTLTRTAVNGVATFNDLSVNKAGQYSLTVSSPPLASVTSNPFTVVPGAPQSLVFASEPAAVALAGTPINPAVRVIVLDGNLNQVTSGSSDITVALQDNSGAPVAGFGGTRTRSLVNGVATFEDLTVDTVGARFKLTATAPGLSGGVSAEFRVVRPQAGFALASLSVGLDQTCGLNSTGSAYCWGANDAGQLGDGTRASRATPAPVSGGLSFIALSAGGGGYEEDLSFACGVTTAGDAYCWGGTLRGALGEGSEEIVHPTPVPVGGGLKFAAISAGGAHVCALTSAGVAYCWGSNSYGELGVDDFAMRSMPTAVVTTLVFTTIAAGDFHTCATTTSATYCWGLNWGGMGEVPTPTLVNGSVTFTKISAATASTCGLDATGVAYCWGENSEGQLGNGGGGRTATPTAVSGGQLYSAISTKGSTACAVSGGAGYCWGWNDLGQLGAGFFTPRDDPQQTTPFKVVGTHTFSAVSVGVWHACALTTSGLPYCWGLNSNGQLGNDTGVNSPVPVPAVPPDR